MCTKRMCIETEHERAACRAGAFRKWMRPDGYRLTPNRSSDHSGGATHCATKGKMAAATRGEGSFISSSSLKGAFASSRRDGRRPTCWGGWHAPTTTSDTQVAHMLMAIGNQDGHATGERSSGRADGV